MRWYHTIELPGGIVTPGEYDLRGIAAKLPWPSLDGARCLDVGSRDGFYAFEMERRGAREVVSVDIDDPGALDFPGPPGAAPSSEAVRSELDAGHRAFEVARRALDSRVERRLASVYELRPDDFGKFDFAVIGTLLLHLRDPVRALQAVRGVVGGQLLVNEPIIPSLASLWRLPVAELMMADGLPFWLLPNPAALRRFAEAGGFEVLATSRPYLIPHGARRRAAPSGPLFRGSMRGAIARSLGRRGSPHAWVLAASRGDPV